MKYLFKNILVAAFVLGCIAPLMAMDSKLALLVQKSPEYGGSVTLLNGANVSGGLNLVGINAVPKEGFEFVYWLGDVTEPANRNTTVLVDSPKIVVAVFERAELVTVPSSGVSAAPASGRGAPKTPPLNAAPQLRGLSSAAYASPPPEPPPGPGPILVPEPATMLILGAGALILSRRRKS